MIFLESCPFCRSSLKTLFVEIHVNYIHFYYIVKMYIYYMVSQYIYLNIGANVFEVGKFIYMYICIYIERVIISGHKWSTTQSAQISQKQVERNLYAINKTMCPPGYHHHIYIYTNKMIHGGCKYLLKDAKTFILIRKGKEYQNLSTIKHI